MAFECANYNVISQVLASLRNPPKNQRGTKVAPSALVKVKARWGLSIEAKMDRLDLLPSLHPIHRPSSWTTTRKP